MKTEWIALNAVQYEVASEWLLKVLEKMAIEDSKGVEGDKSSYIIGRKEHLYEALDDPHFAEPIIELAKEENVIIIEKPVQIDSKISN